MRLLHRLWTEEEGYILSSEVVLLGSLLIVGSIAGITAVRDSIVGEMEDVSRSLGGLNQSFSIVGIEHTNRSGVGTWNNATNSFNTFGTMGAGRTYAYTAGSAYLEKPENRDNSVRFNGGSYGTEGGGAIQTIGKAR